MTGYEIKNMIMDRLRLSIMTYQEICAYTGLTNEVMTNHLQALRRARFVEMIPGTGRINYYKAINKKDKYEDVIKKSAEEKRKKEMPTFSDKATMKVTSNDYHTKGSSEKKCAWIGSTFGTMEY
jgi:DNA-binding transcriptional ArsR family regulator